MCKYSTSINLTKPAFGVVNKGLLHAIFRHVYTCASISQTKELMSVMHSTIQEEISLETVAQMEQTLFHVTPGCLLTQGDGYCSHAVVALLPLQ